MGLLRTAFYMSLGAGALYVYNNYVKPSREEARTAPPPMRTAGT